MILHTTSEGITFAKKLEDDAAEFYESLAAKNIRDAGVFLSFAKDNKKNTVQIDRAYYGVITDAIEGGYAFNLDPDNYILQTAVKDGTDDKEILGRALEIEKTIIRFYTDAAEQSKSLMADIPRAFSIIARKRGSRLEKLDSLLKT
jgi:rubrerythrin